MKKLGDFSPPAPPLSTPLEWKSVTNSQVLYAATIGEDLLNISTVRQQLGGDLLNAHGQVATIGEDLLNVGGQAATIGGDLLNVGGQAARGFTKCWW